MVVEDPRSAVWDIVVTVTVTAGSVAGSVSLFWRTRVGSGVEVIARPDPRPVKNATGL